MKQILFIFSLVFVVMTNIGATVCPDGRVKCPNSMTCCALEGGGYGCCPYKAASCCSDKVHCCPNGFVCDVTGQSCHLKGSPLAYHWFVPLHTQPIKPVVQEHNEIRYIDYDLNKSKISDPGGKCPDGKPCPEKLTCCELVANNTYGCCPYENAMCCTDKIHCCPKGTTCNVTQGSCDVQHVPNRVVRMYSMVTRHLTTKRSSHQIPTDALVDLAGSRAQVTCPNGESCSANQKCTKRGCCDFKEVGDVCDNFDFCCPLGTVCSTHNLCRHVDDPSVSMTGYSLKPFLSLPTPIMPKYPLTSAVTKVTNVTMFYVTCPDGSYCNDYNTCCSMSPGRYGCCPMVMATCCPDHKHCCPHGYHCTSLQCEPAVNHPDVSNFHKQKTNKNEDYEDDEVYKVIMFH